ncbi:MAG: hypothetical protein C0418_02385 [Coriobacteriaceae bacterium]|nr:hypothetical protein [Coriobacteriaceae bacterium]
MNPRTLRIVILVLGAAILVVTGALVRFLVTMDPTTPRNEMDRAFVAAQEAVRANPDDAASRVKLAAALIERGDAGGAEEQARIAVRLDPTDPSTFYVLGLALSAQGKDEAAVAELEKAAQTGGQVAGFYQDAWMALGRAYERSGEESKSIAAMSKALGFGPENVLIIYERGAMYERLKMWVEALDDYAAALEYVPDHKPSREGFDRVKGAHPEAFETLRKLYNEATSTTAPGR